MQLALVTTKDTWSSVHGHGMRIGSRTVSAGIKEVSSLIKLAVVDYIINIRRAYASIVIYFN